MQDIVFISDLHLAPERPEIIELFLRFADEVAADADTLYILGDFLEYWLGDDDPSTSLKPVFDKLIELEEKHGTKVFLMHGNRDFLVGEKLAEKCHFTLISEPHKIKIDDRDALLMHGDTLCTDDVEYQKFRQMVRSAQWQQDILSKSIEERIQIAQALRAQSQQSNNDKEEYIMDVNQDATDNVFRENAVDLMIHGHTHRPNIHHKTVDDNDTTRIVLGDWFKTGSFLRINDSTEPELQTFK